MKRPSLIQVPQNEKKVLLHTCCAPCSCSIIQRLREGGIEPTVYFYNPNISPEEEYERRKKEVLRYIQKVKVPFVDADYEVEGWRKATQGHDADDERGPRCTLCFEMRLGKTAAYASGNGFKAFTTSLGISRWKDIEQVDRAGKRAASLFPGLIYWEQNWRLGGGQELRDRIVKEEDFFRQTYCGCDYSLRDSVRRRLTKKAKDQPAR